MYTLGRLHIPDERDAAHGFSTAGRFAISKETKYWRTGPVLNQLDKPHCVAFAWKQYLQCSPMRQAKGMHEDFLYELAQKVDRWPGEDYDGTSVRAGAKTLARMGFIDKYIWARGAGDVKNWVLSNSPVVLGTSWYEGMFKPDSKGYVHPTGNAAGGHAYLCTGYSAKRNAFRCINSWGVEWGQKGKFWINAADLHSLIVNSGEACTATEGIV